MQVQYVYHCCLFLIFDQTTMAQEQKYLRRRNHMICSGSRYQNSTQPVYSPDILQYQVTYMIWLRYYGHLAKFDHGWYPSSQLVPFVTVDALRQRIRLVSSRHG